MAAEPMEQFQKAVLDGDAAALQHLLQQPELKARIGEPVFFFDSPAIVIAAGRGYHGVIDALLDAGADINARSSWWAGGFGVLDTADPELSQYLIRRGARLDAHSAARLGMLDTLQELVGPNPQLVHARGGDGQTPLHFAATVEIAAYLLDHGAEIDARDIDHESTAAQYRVRTHPEVARYLIRRGCQTDILMAAAVGDAALVEKHLDLDPQSIRMSVNEEHFPKRDPRAGGTIYIWTLGLHKTAHQIAREFGHPEVLHLLMDRSEATPDVKLINACWLGDEAAARALLAAHPGLVQTLSSAGLHQVTQAAETNNTEAVRLMLACGWPADGGHGETPLHYAAWNGNASMTRLILQYTPPLETTDPRFQATPLGWAIHGSEHGDRRQTGDYAATVAALLDAGATPPAHAQGSPAVRAVLRASRFPPA